MSEYVGKDESMKISFYSNYLNHHQIPFCIEMYNLLGDDYKFIATEPMEDERVKLGCSNFNNPDLLINLPTGPVPSLMLDYETFECPQKVVEENKNDKTAKQKVRYFEDIGL